MRPTEIWFDPVGKRKLMRIIALERAPQIRPTSMAGIAMTTILPIFACFNHKAQTMNTNIRFQIGSTWLCVEASKGHAPEHPNDVTVALRESGPNGQPGRRIAANPATQRNEILALGLKLLDLADRMTPKTTWSSSQTAADTTQPPRALNLGAADLELIERPSVDNPIGFARHAFASSERLRARMPILHTAQRVLEHCDDTTATALHVILAAADMLGGLPFTSALAVAQPEQSPRFESCADDTIKH
jgi:hypothetical protein